MKNPPNAGDKKMLPRMATYGLQIVSPSGGWPAGLAEPEIDDSGAGATAGEVITGNGGGPDARIGAGAGAAAGSGGGPGRGVSAGFASSVAAALLATPPAEGGWAASDGGFASVASEDSFSIGAGVAADADAKNSEIGFQEDFASSQARSVELRLPSAIFSRMADSEKRPANCPFR